MTKKSFSENVIELFGQTVKLAGMRKGKKKKEDCLKKKKPFKTLNGF